MRRILSGKKMMFAGLYLSALVGGGFATGREVFVYFVRFGAAGLSGCLAACVLLGFFGERILRVSFAASADCTGTFLRSVTAGRAVSFWNAVVPFFSFCGYVTVLAGFRNLTEQILPCPDTPFGNANALAVTLIAVLFSLLPVFGGFRRFAAACGVLTPILILGIAGFALLVSCRGGACPAETQAISPSSVPAYTFLYIGYNFLFLVGVLGRAGSLADEIDDIRHGARLGALFFTLGCAGVFIALYKNGAGLAECAMPLQELVRRTGGKTVGLIYTGLLAAVLLLCAAAGLTSCLGAFYNGSLMRRIRRHRFFKARPICEKQVGCALALCAFPLSFAGFNTIVTVVYPIFGFLGIFLLGILAQSRPKIV